MYFGFLNIGIKYEKKLILDDVTMEFPKGSINIIIGRNGCGKSSLLKCVSGAVSPFKGCVEFEDKNIREYSRKFVAKKVAYLPQMHYSPQDLDVYTLISYGRYPYRMLGKGRTKEDADVIEKTLEMVGLSELRNHKLNTLSGGEKQRTWIAMTLCKQPEVLILDEPTTYLDISYQIEVLDMVKKLNEECGITIIMVLHDLNLAARYADYLYAIKNGKLCVKGKPSEVLTVASMRDIFQIDTIIQEDSVHNCPYSIPLHMIKSEAI